MQSKFCFDLTTELDQFTDVIPPEGPGDPDRGRIEAVVHGLTCPTIVYLARGQEDLEADIEVKAGAAEVVDNN